MKNENLNFSNYLNIEKKILDKYNLFNGSLVADNESFVDPILLYSSDNPQYRKAHDDMIKYLVFLKNKTILNKEISKADKNKYFMFKEIKQNWLGFSELGNQGRGLGNKFANDIINTLKKCYSSSEKSDISHIEELCLFKFGRGMDSISDFTVCLIKKFLLDLTEEFAKIHIDKSYCKTFIVERVEFDYSNESWLSKEYYLPCYNNDFLLFTPKDILMKETFITFKGLSSQFEYLISNLENHRARDRINEHLNRQISSQEKRKLIEDTISQYPTIVDQYIDNMVGQSQIAIHQNIRFIQNLEKSTQDSLLSIISGLKRETNFFEINPDFSLSSAIQRTSILVDYINQRKNSDLFKVNGKQIHSNLIKKLFLNTWYFELNNKKSTKYKIEFIPVKNAKIKNHLTHHFITKNNAHLLSCYICLDGKEYERLIKDINSISLSKNQNIFVMKCFD